MKNFLNFDNYCIFYFYYSQVGLEREELVYFYSLKVQEIIEWELGYLFFGFEVFCIR